MRRISKTAASMLLAAQVGCTAPRLVRSPASELAAAREGHTVVTQSDGVRVSIRDAFVRGDSIFGTDSRGRRYRLPLREAETIRVRRMSMARTALLGAGIAATLGIAVILVRSGGSGPVQFVFTDCDKHPDSLACM
jgi:hypothetical protein